MSMIRNFAASRGTKLSQRFRTDAQFVRVLCLEARQVVRVRRTHRAGAHPLNTRGQRWGRVRLEGQADRTYTEIVKVIKVGRTHTL